MEQPLSSSDDSSAIAVIGISARFPGAPSWRDFWQNLIQGHESVSFFDEKKEAHLYVPAKPFIENSDCFDADFFHISSKEAALMDPQHRLLLQSAWHACEDAGYKPDSIPARVGVFASSNFNTYQHVDGWLSTYWKEMRDKPSARFTAYTGNIQDTLATRISYKLNLKGPSVTVQTACSSALVALHLACQSLLLGESDLAIAGAVALSFPDKEGYVYEEGMILSKDGHCKAFDRDASGTIFGNGVSSVLLKPLDRAIADNDHIYGVIRGSAINNDGSRKVDFNAPSVIGQKEVIQNAQAIAGITPDQLSYIEAHGTGTLIGDPIEIQALKEAFGDSSYQKPWCGIGTVKTNIGHLDAAAGMAGLIKVLLSLKHGLIPATLHFKDLNPHVDLKKSPFFIVDSNQTWQRSKTPRYCAVTSLGIGGTNAHMVLQEAPQRQTTLEQTECLPFLLSAETQEQLICYIDDLLVALKILPQEHTLADVVFTLGTSRILKKYKCIGAVRTLDELQTALLDVRNEKISPLCFTTDPLVKELNISLEAKKWISAIIQEDFSIEPPFHAQRIPLPGYPFAKTKYWFDQVIDTQDKIFSRQIPLDPKMSFVRDHVIEGKCLFPAAGFLAFAYQIYPYKSEQNQAVVLENITFLHPLVIDSSGSSVTLNWLPKEGKASFQFSSLNQIYSKGSASLISLTPFDIPSIDIKTLLQESLPIQCDNPYSHYKTQGIQYGASFQRIQELYQHDDQKVIAKIVLHEEPSNLDYPPQMIDAALQAALGIAYLRGSTHKPSDGFIPFLIEKATFYSPITTVLYAVLTPSLQKHASSISYAVTAYNPDGRPVFSLEGVKETLINKEKTPIINRFISWFARAVGKNEASIDLKEPLATYNIDSILAISLADDISKLFFPCSKSIFFEFYTLHDLFESLRSKMDQSHIAPLPISLEPQNSEFAVAIVGLSGYYPQSSTLKELWEHLLNGDNLVTEIPKDRWDHSLYFSKEQGVLGKTYSQWGGFLKNIDAFDPLFFKISPREAALLDPQERLFLQSAWHALEDAGYTPAALAEKTNHAVGVYVGAMYQEYQLFGIEERMQGNPVIINGILSTIPNRVSYFCDFRGPSFAVDTMCSSSLTALHLACQDLRLGTTRAALVGGVNITPHPNKYLQLAQERILADDGLCKSFGPGGSGYVPSEGIGCILIKPLQDAQNDRDHIYGVIRGIQINHGGKTNSFTVPNAQAQAEIIKKTLQTSGISPRDISYVEAHGTGTSLGDPIEIRALTDAFGSTEGQYCSIGSIKSNMGHTESNAGIAGLTKILLQLKYKTLVPSIHAEKLNPNIDFSRTPFKVQKQVEAWGSRHATRIAALSSFGAGGSNAHALIEEFPLPSSPSFDQPVCILLSAKSHNTLRTIARNLSAALNQEPLSLHDVAFTLSVGREALSFKAAFVARSIDDCHRLLLCVANDTPTSEITFSHQTLLHDKETILKALQEYNLSLLIHAWTGGSVIDWEKLYEGTMARRVSLPTYPFEELTCRFTPSVKRKNESHLHPLLHENISTLEEVIFRSIFCKDTLLIQDHKLDNQTLFPGAAYVEMALNSAQKALNKNVYGASLQIRWLKPLYLSDTPNPLFISVLPKREGVDFEIWSQEENKERILCQGHLISVEEKKSSATPSLSWEAYPHFYPKETCYQKLKEFHFDYGPSYQTLQRVAAGPKEIIAEAHLSEKESLDGFIIHPILLDAAFQSTVAIDFERASEYTYVPHSIAALHVYAPLSRKIMIHVIQQEHVEGISRKYNISLYDDHNKLCAFIEGFEEKPLLQKTTTQEITKTPSNTSKEVLYDWLRSTLAQLLNVQEQLLTEDSSFDELGIDSVLSMNLISHLEKEVGALPKTLFFEYTTLSELTEYFLKNTTYSPKASSETIPAVYVPPVASPQLSLRKQEKTFTSSQKTGPIDIAIIGIAGRYPQADTLEELWTHLVAGNNCIEEIPEDRFDYKTIFEPHTTEAGKTKSKWGGFLKDIFSFDPLFFKLSPFDAERSDPQEKLFVQTVWHAMEDAGYSKERLAKISGRAVGVYVGSMYQEYQLYNSEQILLGNPLILEGSASTISNRISYFLNLTGPSLTIDTMCSSALTALYLACNDLILGKCKMAIAGGVNVTVHRNKYLALSYQGFLSTNGLCKSFGKGGDGYVPSEGVGAVILKPLSEAIKDRDTIYGVIKGIDINHGGKAGGFTVPSSPAQAEAITTALKQSHLEPDDISYIEAHGTGTALGDPIEISGLTQAFSARNQKKKIPIGSIKSNIGHTEAAAGIAALSKVLLQMRYKTLVPSIHNDPPNPYIDFEAIPFSVQKEVTPWTSNHRTALISSFGAGGSNAAVVIQEYPQDRNVQAVHKLSKLFILSALNQERLRAYATVFLQFLSEQNPQTFPLANCIYTLQIGRDVFAHRLAIVFENFEDLLAKLQGYAEEKTLAGVHTTSAQSFHTMLENVGIQDDFQEFIRLQISSFSLQKLAKLWVQGTQLDWESLYAGTHFCVMSLPPYPFATVRCWATFNPLQNISTTTVAKTPLVHENTSDLKGLRFNSVFPGSEPLLRDHQIQGAILLPGAAILEMAISASRLVSDTAHFQVENMLWLRPVILEKETLTTHVRLKLESDQSLRMSLLNEAEDLCSQCSLTLIEQEPPAEQLDIASLKTGLNKQMFHAEIYDRFAEEGFAFGPTFKTVQNILFSEDALLAEIQLPAETSQYSTCAINPYWVDAMLQTTIALSSSEDTSIPFRIGKLAFRSIESTTALVYGKRSHSLDGGSSYDLFLLNEEGEILISLYQFEDRPIHKQQTKVIDPIEQVLKLLSNQECSVEEAETMITLLSE